MGTLSRRSFVTALTTGMAAAALGACTGAPVTLSGTRSSTVPRAARGRALPIPPLAESVTDGGIRRFHLTAAPGTTEMIAGSSTPTWGFNGGILGPTLRVRRGEQVAVTVGNQLPESTSVHWHGMHMPARCDGGPHQPIAPAATWEPRWTINQPGATLWYHPHPHGMTEKHVYRGLAGLFIVDDDTTERADLPKTYGVDDIPLIVQDKKLRPDGTLDETDDKVTGLLGRTILTNGISEAVLPVTTQRVRLRMLNGSTARLYNFGFADDREFSVVGTDGGLLARPVAVTRIALSPGERVEIVVDAGTEPVMLRSFAIDDAAGLGPDAAAFGVDDELDILELVPAETLAASPALPATLAGIPAIDVSAAAAQRSFTLKWFMINHTRMDMNRIDLSVAVDSVEVWTVRNADNWPHNFHVHDVQFQVLDVNGTAPPPWLGGWKDTVYLPPGTPIRLAMRFADYTDPTLPYMYHCHMLMHEDQGMMGQFLVLGPGQPPAPAPMPGMAGHGRPGDESTTR